jgi:alpha-tubulin suppressor-like RCC1 family protein
VLSAGLYHFCAIRAETGGVVCWGRNLFTQSTPPPTVDGTLGTAFAVSAGYEHSCAIQTGSGQVICWGDNRYGRAAPSLDGVVAGAIAAGGTHTLAIALPEPDQVASLFAGCALLGVLSRRRRV